MAYRIAYRGRGKAHFRNCKRGPIPRRWAILGCVVLIFAAVLLGWKNEIVRGILLPGDPEVTAAALGELVNGLRDGEGLKEAVTAFCIEVMENAQIPR